MGEKGDGGLEGPEGGGVPVIEYAPVIEAGGRWGFAWFAGGGFLLGIVAWTEKATNETSVWSFAVFVLVLLVVGWVVRSWVYWKSVAMGIGCSLGSEASAMVARMLSGVGWSNVGDDGWAFYLVQMSIASSTGAVIMGLLALASSGVRELVEYKGWIEPRG